VEHPWVRRGMILAMSFLARVGRVDIHPGPVVGHSLIGSSALASQLSHPAHSSNSSRGADGYKPVGLDPSPGPFRSPNSCRLSLDRSVGVCYTRWRILSVLVVFYSIDA